MNLSDKSNEECMQAVRGIPTPYRNDMRAIMDKLFDDPKTNPFIMSTLNSAYFVPRFQWVTDLLQRYQEEMQRIPHVGNTKKGID